MAADAKGKEKETEKKEEEKKERPPKKFPLKWMILGGVAFLLGAAGFFGWTMYKQRAVAEAKQEVEVPQASEKKKKAKVMLPMEPFIVNLMDKNASGKRYLKVTLTFEVATEEEKGLIETHKTPLRDSILLLLSAQSLADVSSVEGKLGLKQAILSRTNQVLGDAIVDRIYFTDFVVQ